MDEDEYRTLVWEQLAFVASSDAFLRVGAIKFLHDVLQRSNHTQQVWFRDELSACSPADRALIEEDAGLLHEHPEWEEAGVGVGVAPPSSSSKKRRCPPVAGQMA